MALLMLLLFLGFASTAIAGEDKYSQVQEFSCDGSCSGTGIDSQCSLGNLALKKPAFQSTTWGNDLSADRAVDGSLPPSNTPSSAQHCSHTAENQTPIAWWYVILSSTSEVYQITNISIVNRQSNMDRLSNFSILYTNDTAEPPSLDTWSVCTYWENASTTIIGNYSCSTIAIGKKVAVYLGKTRENTLTLCEVYIYGFAYKAPEMPRDALLLTSGCNNVTLELTNVSSLPAERIPDGVDIWVDGLIEESISWRANQTKSTYVFKTTPGKVYQISVCPVACSSGFRINGTCIFRKINAGSRQVVSTLKGNCAGFIIKATSRACYVSQNFSVDCEADGVPLLHSDSASVCDLQFGKVYTCTASIKATKDEGYNLRTIIRIPEVNTFTNWNGKQFPCACRGQPQCRRGDGFCSSGCEAGSSGPGCQVGDIFRHACNIEQSSTHFENGTDFYPIFATDRNSTTCSSTTPFLPNDSWWTITLANDSMYYIIRLNISAGTETNISALSILLTNDTDSDPNPTTWMKCGNDLSTNNYFTCTGTVSKRIAIYSSDSSGVSICDLSVIGYVYKDCSEDYIGPGCLLLQNQSTTCRSDTYTLAQVGEYGECLRSRCPGDIYRPTQCYHRMPQINSTSIIASGECEALNITLKSGGTIFQEQNATLRATIRCFSRQLSFNLTENDLPFYEKVNVTFGAYCNFTITAQVCFEGSCAFGPEADMPLFFPKRNVSYVTTDECISFEVSNESNCSKPSSYQVQCNGSEGGSWSNRSSTICHINGSLQYNCTLTVNLDGVAMDYYFSNIVVNTATNAEEPDDQASLIGGITGGLLAILLIFGLVYFFGRSRPKTENTVANVTEAKKFEKGIFSQSDPLIPLPSSQIDSADAIYENLAGMTKEELEGYIKREELIATKFQELSMNETSPSTVGKSPENKQRNRYQNILPYDFNRVVIASTPGNPKGYINASHIKGYSQESKFIASQGPTSKTTSDFWTMVWSQNSPIIIMLTNFVEQGKRKCEEYFPSLASCDSDIQVSVKTSIQFNGYKITDLEIIQGSEHKTVKHCLYQAWPDHSTPEHMAQFTTFRATVRQFSASTTGKQGPIVLHCSAGAGRTGAYIAIENNLDRYHKQHRVDIDSCVLALRQQRTCIVQTTSQYLFVHKAILHGMYTDSFAIPELEVPKLWGSRATDGAAREIHEWTVLQRIMDDAKKDDYGTALLPENILKNRHAEILASDKYRPLLNDTTTGSEIYVNAVYCSGCHGANEFLASQLPLQNTVVDFWNMVVQTNASCIVILEDTSEVEISEIFYPMSQSKAGEAITYGTFTLTHLDEEKISDDIVKKNISLEIIRKSPQDRAIRIYELFGWPKSKDVKSASVVLQNMSSILREWRRDHPENPVLVLCRDGAERTGLFIAAVNILDRYLEDGNLLVFHTVEMLKCIRRQFVRDMDQYSYLYSLMESQHNQSRIYTNS